MTTTTRPLASTTRNGHRAVLRCHELQVWFIAEHLVEMKLVDD